MNIFEKSSDEFARKLWAVLLAACVCGRMTVLSECGPATVQFRSSAAATPAASQQAAHSSGDAAGDRYPSIAWAFPKS